MRKLIANILLLLFSIALFHGCTKEPTENYADVPKEVVDSIKAKASANFSSDKTVEQAYVRRQIAAYRLLTRYMPAIPAERYSKILKYGKEMAGDDYVMVLSEVEEMSENYMRLAGKLESLSKDDADFIKSFFDDKSVVDYKNNLSLAFDWCDTISRLEEMRTKMPKDDFEHLKKRFMSAYKRSPNDVVSAFDAQRRMAEAVSAFKRGGVPESEMAKVKQKIAGDFPYDYDKQYKQLRNYDFSQIIEKAKEGELGTTEEVAYKKNQKKLRSEAEDIFRECVFTQHGQGDKINVAVLVKLNGQTAVICTKDFVPHKMPVVFGNSRGMIKCSKAYVSEEFPLIMMIPDKEPEMFTPIEIISAKEAVDLPDKELYLIAPHEGGFTGRSIKVFSEDIKFLNFAEKDTPKTKRSMDFKRLDRKGSKFLINIRDQFDIGENAVVFDAKSRKLVSVALRYYDAGMIDFAGKTGNIMGYENAPVPDFVNFIRMFDGNVQRTSYAPPSQIRFVRLTALDKWRRFDVKEFWAQKNAIRKYTDANNDYMKFVFSENGYFAVDTALRSTRLSRIAMRYQKDFKSSMSDSNFRLRYESFIVDILNSMRMDMNKAGNSSYTPMSVYSIYREELAYQMALRKSLYNYMKEFLRDGNITAFIKEGIRGFGSDGPSRIGNVNRGQIGSGINVFSK